MGKIFEKSINDDSKEKFYLEILATAQDASTITACCVYMMKLNIYPDITRKKLEELIECKDYHPIFIFNVKMVLQEWDKGNIKPIV